MTMSRVIQLVACVLLLCNVLVLAQREKPSRLGEVFVDEIRGLHQPHVDIPSIQSNRINADHLTVNAINALQEKFSATSAGPISLRALTQNIIATNTFVSTETGGVIETQAQRVGIQSSQTTLASGNGLHTHADSTVRIANAHGPLLVNSPAQFSLDGTNALELVSFHGDVAFSSPNGALTLDGNHVLLSTGDVFHGTGLTISSPDFNIEANRDLWIRGQKTSITAKNDVLVSSDSGDFLLQGTTAKILSEETNFAAQQDFVVHSLLSDISFDARDVSFTSHTAAFKSNAVSITGSTVDIEATGSVSYEAPSVSFSASSAGNFATLNGALVVNTDSQVLFQGQFNVNSPFISILTDTDKATDSFTGDKVVVASTKLSIDASSVSSTSPTFSISAADTLIRVPNQQKNSDGSLHDGILSVSGTTFTSNSNRVAVKLDGTLTSTGKLTVTSDNTQVYGRSSLALNGNTLNLNGASTLAVSAPQGSVQLQSSSTDYTYTGAALFSGKNVLVQGPQQTFTEESLSISGDDVVWNSAAIELSATTTALFQANANGKTAVQFAVNNGVLSLTAPVTSFTGGSISLLSSNTNSFEMDSLSLSSVRDTKLYAGTASLFTVAGAASITADSVFSQASDSLSIQSDKLVNLNGKSFTARSAGTAKFTSSRLAVNAGQFIKLTAFDEADNLVSVKVTETATWSAGGAFSLSGGSASIGATGGNLDIQSTLGITNTAAVDFTVSSFDTSLSTTNGTASVTSGRSLGITSSSTFTSTTADLTQLSATRARGGLTFDSNGEIRFRASGTTRVTSDNLGADALSFTKLVAPSTSFSGERISVLSGQNIAVTAPTTTFTFPTTEEVIGGLKITTNNVFPMVACAGDIRLRGNLVTVTAGDNVDIVQRSVCNKQQFGTFAVNVTAARGTASLTAQRQFYDGGREFSVIGGEIGLTATLPNDPDGLLSIVSPNALPFTSLSGTLQTDHSLRRDEIIAAGIAAIDADRGVSIIADGLDSNKFYQDFGVVLESTGTANDLNVFVSDGALNVNGLRGLRLATTTASPTQLFPGQQVLVTATGDVLFNTTTGGVSLSASGVANATAVGLSNVGVAAYATEGDVYVHAHRAGFSARASDLAAVRSLLGPISFVVGDDLIQRSGEPAGRIRYTSVLGKIDMVASQDVSLIAGSTTNDADLSLLAYENLSITSQQRQRYHQGGATSSKVQDAVELASSYGDISISAAEELQVDGAGAVAFNALTENLSLTAANDVRLTSDNARVNVNSSRTITIDSLAGNVRIAAAGGGGSVTVRSDSGQDLVATSGKGIAFTANETSVFFANNYLSAVALNGNLNTRSQAGTLFHSLGEIHLESLGTRNAPNDGIYFDGGVVSVYSQHDTIIDATLFSVGAASPSSKATDPVVNINAGGTDTLNGFSVESRGNIRHTTNKADSSITFSANTIDLDANNNALFYSNGPISFENAAKGASGRFVVDAFAGVLDVYGGHVAELRASTTLEANSKGALLFSATGQSGGNGFYFEAERDLRVRANAQFTTDISTTSQINVRDWSVDAANQLTIANTDGGRGTLGFSSDWTLTLDARRALTVNTENNGPINVVSRGDLSNINVRAVDTTTQADVTVTSAESIAYQGRSVNIDGRNSVSFDATGAGIAVISTDATVFGANNTWSLTAVKAISLDAGDETPSLFSVQSSGTTTFNAANSVFVSTELVDSDLSFEADGDINVMNFANPNQRLRGSVRIESESDSLFSTNSGDATFRSELEELEITARQSALFVAKQGISVIADSPLQNKIYLNARQSNVVVQADYESRFNACSPTVLSSLLLKATGKFTWNAIDLGSTGPSIHAGDDFSLTAATTGTISAFQGVRSTSTLATTITTGGTADLSTSLADILFETQSGSVAFTATTGVFSIHGNANPNRPDNTLYQTGSVSFTAPTQVAYTAGTDFTVQAAAAVSFTAGTAGAISTAASATINAPLGAVKMVSSGVDSTGTYGMLLEGDELVSVSASNVFMRSSAGVVSINAEEVMNIGSTASTKLIQLTASDQVLVESGFVAPQFVPFRDTTGVELVANSQFIVESENRNVYINGWDVSFGSQQSLTVLSNSEDYGSVRFGGEAVSVTAALFTTNSGNDVIFDASSSASFSYNSINLASALNLNLETARDIVFAGNGGLSIDAVGGVKLHAPFGAYVDFQNDDLINDSTRNGQALFQVLLIPELDRQADRQLEPNPSNPPQNVNLPFMEDEPPGCTNRQFGVDSTSGHLCVCDRNKWRCVRPV